MTKAQWGPICPPQREPSLLLTTLLTANVCVLGGGCVPTPTSSPEQEQHEGRDCFSTRSWRGHVRPSPRRAGRPGLPARASITRWPADRAWQWHFPGQTDALKARFQGHPDFKTSNVGRGLCFQHRCVLNAFEVRRGYGAFGSTLITQQP